MTPILAFDIETIPDVRGIRLLNQLPNHLSDEEVVEFALQQNRAKNGSDFMPHHLHQVVAISCCLRTDKTIRVGTIGDESANEAQMIHAFFQTIEKYTPTLVSWNGGGFDLPVLHYRAMIHRIQAARYWDTGEGDFKDSRDFKWNNYINRYHNRHTDLMDLLALYTGRANAPLDDLAKLCGFPGKLGMDGSQVWSAYSSGKIKAIRDYCETDALNTYLMYLRFSLINGTLAVQHYEEEIERVEEYLNQQAQEGKNHWAEFLDEWFAQA